MPKTVGSLDLTQDERGRIVGLKEARWSNRRIAAIIGCDHKTVANIYNSWLEKGNTSSNRQNCTGQRRTVAAQDQAIVACSQQNPFKPATHIVQELHLPVSGRTVRRRLNENALHSYWAARKEALTQAHREERVGFALEHLTKDPDDWRTAIFADESCIQVTNDGRLRVWRRKGERLGEEFLQLVRRSGRFSVPVWGWMSGTGAGHLHHIEGRLNSQQYVDILEHNLRPAVNTLFGAENVSFAHDNSPIHTARIVQDWFIANPQFTCIQWPSRSPDLNPIENAWSKLKRSIDVTGINTAAELWIRADAAWDALVDDLDYWECLSSSMPRRMRKTMDVAGVWTKY